VKKLSIVLVLCFVLSTVGIGSVSAQDSQTGYIPLLTADYDTTIPRQESSRAQFRLLLPDLLKAQEQGLISSFEPDYYGGFISVNYPGVISAESTFSSPVYANLDEVIIPPPHDNAISPEIIGSENTDSADVSPEVEGLYTPMAYIQPYSSCVNMNSLGANARVKASLSRAGTVIAVFDATADSDGYLWECFDGAYASLVPGYSVSFKIYSSSAVYLKTITATVPRIVFTAIDQAQATISGTALAGKAYTATWWQQNLDAGRTWARVEKTGTVTSAGTWKVDFGTTAIRGNAEIDFTLPVNANIIAQVYFYAPSLECNLTSYYCSLNNLPNKTVTMTITHGGVKYTMTGKTNKWGYIYQYLENSYGDPIFLAVGDTITGTGATTLQLRPLSATPNATTNKVTGVAPANTYFYVIFWPVNSNGYVNWTHADSTGRYSSDFTWADIPTGPITSEVEYMSKTTGNYTFYIRQTGF